MLDDRFWNEGCSLRKLGVARVQIRAGPQSIKKHRGRVDLLQLRIRFERKREVGQTF